jgi:hypothetical protein
MVALAYSWVQVITARVGQRRTEQAYSELSSKAGRLAVEMERYANDRYKLKLALEAWKSECVKVRP